MSLYLLLRYIDFDEENDSIIPVEIFDHDGDWQFKDFRDIPFRLLTRKVESFAPIIKDGKAGLWVCLTKEGEDW